MEGGRIHALCSAARLLLDTTGLGVPGDAGVLFCSEKPGAAECRKL